MTTPAGDGPARGHSHYSDANPSARSNPRTVRVTLPDLEFEYVTDAGVFGRHRLDPGTRILLEAAPVLPETGEFLDLGCGAGPLSLAMALRRPASRIWAVDVNDRARALTRDNARALGLANVMTCALEDVPEDIRFDVIWSNPPIKVGKVILQDLLQRWLARLAPSGSAILVVHKNLGSDSLASWLTTLGFDVQRIVSRQGYRLLRIRPGTS